jgi:FkbM family methyltransferase
LISLRQPARLRELARQLQLTGGSTAKLFCAYYGGRRAAFKNLSPETVVLQSSTWGKLPLRTNSHDIEILRQMFIRQDYSLKASGVRRILDLGANIGMASLYLKRLFPDAEFACVEPSPQNVALLKQTLALNAISGRIFEAAAGAEQGEIELHLSDKPDCNSVLPVKGSSRSVRVPLVSVPDIMARMGWDSIDLLKIDIEGAEKDVLSRNNGWLRQVRILIGESHVDVGYSYAALQADLARFGFGVTTLIPETEEYGALFRAERAE